VFPAIARSPEASDLSAHGTSISPDYRIRSWAAGIALIFLAHVILLACVAEDAFIAFRFAKNLAIGRGLVWNAGEAPVEGYTDFLWVLLSAATIRLGLNVVLFAQVAGVAAAYGTLWLIWRAGRRHLRLEPVVAILPVLLLAVAGPFATWAASGMEMSFFTWLALLSAYLVAEVWQNDRSRAAAWSAITLVAATLTRPEGAMLAALLLGGSTLAALAVRRRLSEFTAATALYLGLFGLYFAWRYSRYGYLLPNTFYAKTGGGLDQVLRGGLLTFLFYMQFVLPLAPIALVAIWEHGLPSPRVLAGGLASLLQRHALVVCAATVTVVYTLYNIAVGGDYMAMHRFFVPVLPFIYLLTARVASAVHGRIRTRQNALGYSALVAVTGLATFFPSTPLERSFFHAPPQQHGNYRGVQTERWHVSRLSTIGRFFEGYRRDHAESLATSAIGAIGYLADMRILDLHGLVDTHIAHLPAPPDLGRSRPGHGREDLAYTLSLQPTYLMFSRDLTPSPIELWRYVPQELRGHVDRDYVHTAVRLVDTGNSESGYFTFFERRDSAVRRRSR
jgi:arabinofuranosyltransferase